MNNTYCDSNTKQSIISKQSSTVGLSCLKKLSIANKTGFDTKARNLNNKLPPIIQNKTLRNQDKSKMISNLYLSDKNFGKNQSA